MTDTFALFPFDISLPDIVPGSTWTFTFRLPDNAPTTGYGFKMQMREKPNGALAQEITITNGKCVMTASTGQFVITLTPTDTLALGKYNQLVFDCQLTTGIGTETIPLFKGSVKVLTSVTR